jgi:hypothetical protein
MKAVIDLIDYYNWEYVTILYQESTGLGRIEDLIKLPRPSSKTKDSAQAASRSQHVNLNNKIRLQVRELSLNVNEWIHLIKDVKLSGSSHIIADIQNKNLNKFLKQVEK